MKRFFYLLFFIVLNVLYLIVELSFNARLLDVASSMSLLIGFDNLELYGRSISAAGATILFWRLLLPYKEKSNISRTAFKLLLITVIVFPSVFMGQKLLIDQMVDSSTPEMRRSAEILSVLKYGIAHGFVEINELATDDLILQSAEGKMFVALSGLLIYSSDDELLKIEDKLDIIAQYASSTQQAKDASISYRNYQYASFKIADEYKQYAALVSHFDRQQQLSRQKSIALYEQAITHTLLKWEGFTRDKTEISKRYKSKTAELQSLIAVLNEVILVCTDRECVDQMSKQPLSNINKLIEVNSNWEHWCHVQEGGALQCLDEESVVAFKLNKIIHNFLTQKFGFEQYYETKLDYLNSMEFFDNVLLFLEKKGVLLVNDIDLTRHEQIIEEMHSQILMYEQQQYQNKMIQIFGEIIRPRLSIGQFSLLPKMQTFYQKALAKNYLQLLPITLSKKQFIEHYLQPIYVQQYNYLSNKLSSDSSWYEEGAPYEKSGKNSLRNLVVPPIAIAMSLIFGLLNLVSLILSLWFLLIKETLMKRWLGFTLLLVILVFVPKFNAYQIADQRAFQQLIEHTQQQYEYGKVIEIGQWIVKIEPTIYTIGNILRVNVLDGFKFN